MKVKKANMSVLILLKRVDLCSSAVIVKGFEEFDTQLTRSAALFLQSRHNRFKELFSVTV